MSVGSHGGGPGGGLSKYPQVAYATPADLAAYLKRDGSNSPSANIPMGNTKWTGLAAGSANGDSLRYEQLNGLSIPLIWSGNGTQAQALTRWMALSGSMASSATENNARWLTKSACQFKNLRIWVTTNSITGAASTVTLKTASGGATALTTTISASGVGEFVDTTHTVSVSANDYVYWEIVTGATALGNLGWTVLQVDYAVAL